MMVPATEQEIDLEAARWVARMDASWSLEQEAALSAWLDADVKRSGALLRAQAMWLTPDCIEPDGDAAADADTTGGRLSVRRREIIAAGAGAIAASLVGGFAWMTHGESYRTAVGEIRQVPLADGSVVAINTASDLDVDLGRRRRSLRLDRGEAWFQVAKDAARPFVVQAGAVSVEAVGTAFSVRRHEGGAEVLVSEGVVAAWSAADALRRFELKAGDRAVISDAAVIDREPAVPSAVDRALAWRAGMIDLMGDPLNQAIAEFNRYNRRQIVLMDPRLGGEEFDGVFRADDPQGFARAVQASLGVPVDDADPTQIRLGGPPA